MPSDIAWNSLIPQIAPAGWPGAVSTGALADLSFVAERIPVAGTEAFIAEIRLDGADPQVDVSVRLGGTVGRHWAASGEVHPAFDPHHPSWRIVRALLAPDRPPAIADVTRRECWIEFDREPGVQSTPPGVFVSMRRDRTVTARSLVAMLEALDVPLSSTVRRSVSRVFAALPVHARVAQLGVMLSRGVDTPLRLCLTGLSGGELSRFWRAAGGAGADPSRAWRAMPSADAPMLDYVDCDVRDGLEERVGLEFRCDRRAQAAGVLRETPWLRARQADGLISDTWVDALRTWPGARRLRLTHQLWHSLTERTLNHCKLVVTGGEPTALKGYCMLRHQDAPSRRTPRATHDQSPGGIDDRATAVA